jgi:hypothetical protein
MNRDVTQPWWIQARHVHEALPIQPGKATAMQHPVKGGGWEAQPALSATGFDEKPSISQQRQAVSAGLLSGSGGAPAQRHARACLRIRVMARAKATRSSIPNMSAAGGGAYR